MRRKGLPKSVTDLMSDKLELIDKRVALVEYSASEEFLELSTEERELIGNQIMVMEQYINILERRFACFADK